MGKLINRIPEWLAKKEVRDNARYSQRDMARGVGLSDNAISRVMRYDTLDNVPLGTILQIADWLGVENPRDLVGIVDEE